MGQFLDRRICFGNISKIEKEMEYDREEQSVLPELIMESHKEILNQHGAFFLFIVDKRYRLINYIS